MPVGIPRPAYRGNVAALNAWNSLLAMQSLHEARRAGKHYDFRMGTPRTGLFSWATKKELPISPGKTIALYQQPVHSWKYQDFSGEIPEGYGAGKVHPAVKYDAILHEATPDKLVFSMQTDTGINRYQMVRVRNSGSKPVWYLTNITPSLDNRPQKLHYKQISEEQARALINELGKSVASIQPKIDGALVLVHINDGKLELYSHRESAKTGKPILHTERVFGTPPKVNVPNTLNDTVLLGELYAVKREADGKERILSPVELSALLNSGLAKSKEKQKQLGVDFRVFLFDAAKMGKVDDEWSKWYERPYIERKNYLAHITKYLPENFHAPIEANNPKDAERLLKDIRRRTYPLTREGVVLFPNQGIPLKLKFNEEKDVYIRNILEGEGRFKGTAAGGFTYSAEPEGPELGTVGSGLTEDLRKEMFKSPESFVGRKARVKYQEQFPSGALRAPSLIALHEG